MPANSVEHEDVAVLAPTGRDGDLIAALLQQHGLTSHRVNSGAELAHEISCGLGTAVITEEALTPEAIIKLDETLRTQPAWSDFPLLVLSGHGVVPGSRPALGLKALGNVTLLDRPVQTRTLLSAVRAALRGRAKQYEARKAIEARDRFLAMLGHELRNPLGAILFASEKLKRGAGTEPSARHVEMVNRQALLLARLVDDLLDVSRVTQGKIVLDRQRVDLRKLVEGGVAAVDTWARARRMRVFVSLGDDPVWVDADVMRLEQVLSNLLVNAIKYTCEGGEIGVRVAKNGEGRAELRVKDSGVGIAPESLERIFELFAQADTSLDRAQGGLGLGLTLVRNLIELHGGAVVAHSEGCGHGSEFVVQLPSAVAEVAPVVTKVAGVRATSLKVVVVEDNSDLREMLAELLVEEGHTVTAAAEGSSGLSLITASLPDLALVDIGLPGIDGYQVAEEVRRLVGKRVRMVALSGYGQPEDKARALRAGFDAHLTKPIDMELLHSVISG